MSTRHQEISDAICSIPFRNWPSSVTGMHESTAYLIGRLSGIAESAPIGIAERLLAAVDKSFPAAPKEGAAS